jgi:hypothetical protein
MAAMIARKKAARMPRAITPVMRLAAQRFLRAFGEYRYRDSRAFGEYRYRDSNPGFRHERAAS